MKNIMEFERNTFHNQSQVLDSGSLVPPNEPTPLDISTEIRGITMEKKAADVIRTLPYVDEVQLTGKDSELDAQMVDAIVIFSEDTSTAPPSIGELVVKDALLQIKSSTMGDWHFRETLSKRGVSGTEARKDWMLKNRMILLVVDFKTSRSKKNIRRVGDEEIIFDFETQLRAINSYARGHMDSEE